VDNNHHDRKQLEHAAAIIIQSNIMPSI